ncbi:MAG TPA: DUF2924 domain-containing protein [Microvirga sp.]|jgi:hypothetical protein|nr:DUF2924 domain-containing protein [Microvirga sp.]
MARQTLTPEDLIREIAGLGSLDLADLRQRWQRLYGTPAPASFRRDLLVRAIAYQMQVKAYGGLSLATKRRLRQIAEAVRQGSFEASMAGPRIRPGTRLVRVWQGETHHVFVHEDGYEWQGERHRSLSTIAKAITGTSWNGWTFFGVKKRPARNKNAAGPRRKRVVAAAVVEAAHA